MDNLIEEILAANVRLKDLLDSVPEVFHTRAITWAQTADKEYKTYHQYTNVLEFDYESGQFFIEQSPGRSHCGCCEWERIYIPFSALESDESCALACEKLVENIRDNKKKAELAKQAANEKAALDKERAEKEQLKKLLDKYGSGV